MVGSTDAWRGRGDERESERPTAGMANPLQFLQEVRDEAGKVTWPNRRETVITTVLVILMCVLASLFLLLVDRTILFTINTILGFGR